MSSSNDHIFGVIRFGQVTVVTSIIVATLVQSVATEAAPQTSALVAEYWTPCEAPRPDVACWRSPSRAVVCLPLPHNEETK
jgi:hypothetical protein